MTSLLLALTLTLTLTLISLIPFTEYVRIYSTRAAAPYSVLFLYD